MDTLGPVVKAREAHRGGAAMGGTRLHAHPCLGDHAERSLRTGEHAVGADAGARARQPPGLPNAGWGERADGLDEILDVGPQSREVTRGASGDSATERGESA